MSRQNRLTFACLVALVALAWTANQASASIIFDNFNTDRGHFGYTPTFSSTSNVSSASTAARNATDGADFLGAGHMSLSLVMSTANPARVRWVSGGPAYNSTNAGNPAANITFTVSSSLTDGWIGFYARTTTSGGTLSINLDTTANTGAAMTGGVPKTITPALADGQWHLYEWNLDNLSDWGAVAGIGGGSANLQDQTHAIDSLYIQGVASARAIDIDFVALNSSGSVALLIPEPASLGLLAVAAMGLLRRKRA